MSNYQQSDEGHFDLFARKGKVFMCLFVMFVACSAICAVRTSGGELLFMPPVNFVLFTLLLNFVQRILWWLGAFEITTCQLCTFHLAAKQATLQQDFATPRILQLL